MSLLFRSHQRLVAPRRVQVLGKHLAARITSGSHVLDVGCGDGAIDEWLLSRRPDIEIQGVDVYVRPAVRLAVERFDGRQLPFPDGAFDLVLMVDVVHHAQDPMILLSEAARVARRGILIKDHNREGALAYSTLCAMDVVGNAYRGAVHRFQYWTAAQWRKVFSELGLTLESYEDRLHLYPAAADWLFGRRLHFVALLGKS